MKRWWKQGSLIGLALVAVLIGAAAYKARQVESTGGVQTSNAFTAIRELQSPLVGKAAPAIGLRSVVEGSGSLDLAPHRGKLVLVSFWSHL
ncbi:MAG: hypothetical protein ACOY94_03635 [Bacillota bacterium]